MKDRTIKSTTERVEKLVRLMWAHQHPGKKLEIDREMLELDVIKHACIKAALAEATFFDDDGGAK